MFVCECRVLSGRGLCDELITRPEESYRLWCVVVCDLETSRMRMPWPALGRSATKKKCFTSTVGCRSCHGALLHRPAAKKRRIFVSDLYFTNFEQFESITLCFNSTNAHLDRTCWICILFAHNLTDNGAVEAETCMATSYVTRDYLLTLRLLMSYIYIYGAPISVV